MQLKNYLIAKFFAVMFSLQITQSAQHKHTAQITDSNNN